MKEGLLNRDIEYLGVGQIIAQAFGILKQNWVQMVLGVSALFVIARLLSDVIGYISDGGVAFDPLTSGRTPTWEILSNLFLYLAVYAIGISIVIFMVDGLRQGKPRKFGEYLSQSWGFVLPLSVLFVVSTIITVIGWMFWIVPGLWLHGVLYATAPSIVLGQAGFSGLGRSGTLSKGYRWPIVGLTVLFILIMIGVSFVLALLSEFVTLPSFGVAGNVLSILLNGLSLGFTLSFHGILVALVYFRLLEIKEGGVIENVADVFD